jgi:hypothetical protein
VSRVALVLLALYGAAVWMFRGVRFDDVFISFRYARNWAHGFGPTFNPAQAPAEGFSNPLLVFLSSVCIRAGLDPVVVAKLLAVLAGGGCVLLVLRTARRLELARASGVAAAVMLASCVPFLYWIGSGIENGLFSLLLLASVQEAALSSRAGPRLAALFVLLSLARPEGIVLSFVLLGARLLARRGTTPALDEARVALAVAVAFSAFLAWRHATFGDWLPNTYYSKMGGELTARAARGAAELAYGAGAVGLPLAALAACGAVLALRDSGLWCVLAVSAAGAAYELLTGGDVNVPRLRFVVLYAPVAAILAAKGLHAVCGRMPAKLRVPAAAVLAAGNAALSAGASRDPYLLESWRTGATFDAHVMLGRRLAEELPRGARVALWDIGIMGYEMREQHVVDMTGLTDPFIARMPGGHFAKVSDDVVAHLLEQEPDVWILNLVRVEGRGLVPEFPIVRAVIQDPRFAARHSFEGAEHTIGLYHLGVFRRKPRSTPTAPLEAR